MKLRIALVLSAALLGPSIADACVNSMMLEGDAAVKQIAKAEKMLEQGKLGKASNLVASHEVYFREKRMRDKANLVRYTVVARKKKATEFQVKQAKDFFERARTQKPKDPLLISRQAELLALSAKTTAQAQEALEDLAKRDLMPEAQGYAALARIHERAGRKDAAKGALGKCQAMTKHRAVCSLALTKVTTKPARRGRSRGVIGSKSAGGSVGLGSME